MKFAAEHQLEHIGESCGCEDHDRDLVHELGKRLDALWRYDQYISNAKGHEALQDFWRDVKRQESENIERMKSLVANEIEQGCF